MERSVQKVIDLDGAFLKGGCKGEPLTCISKNENNQMYPIAWAVVDKETKKTWSWFLKCIRHDLELIEGEELTLKYDMQKVLLPLFHKEWSGLTWHEV